MATPSHFGGHPRPFQLKKEKICIRQYARAYDFLFINKLLKIFTFTRAYVIINNVKRFAIALLAAATFTTCTVCAAATGIKTQYANAEESQTIYPDFVSDLETGGIDCYAVGENEFAFSRDEYIFIYSGGSMSKTPQSDGQGGFSYYFEGGVMTNSTEDNIYAYRHTSTIVNLGYAEGSLLFTDATGADYSYSDGKATQSESAPAAQKERIFYGDILLYIADGTLLAMDTSSADSVPVKPAPDSTFSCLQEAVNGAYAIMDGGLCYIERGTDSLVSVTPVKFRYTDVSHSETIATGDTAELLKQTRDVTFTMLASNKYVTEIDLSDLSGQYFKVAEGGTFRLEKDTPALILCTTGNADIVAIGEKSYITLKTDSPQTAITTVPQFTGAQLNYAAGIYSSPYMCDATELIQLEPGAKVTVSEEIVASQQTSVLGALAANFCKVTYTAADGQQIEGYIATSFLTAYDFSGEDGDFGEPQTPENYSEDNVILTVVLIIVIVVIVIAGVAYLAYSSGSGKHKKETPTDEEKKG